MVVPIVVGEQEGLCLSNFTAVLEGPGVQGVVN